MPLMEKGFRSQIHHFLSPLVINPNRALSFRMKGGRKEGRMRNERKTYR